jgi:hypothetical protein
VVDEWVPLERERAPVPERQDLIIVAARCPTGLGRDMFGDLRL